MTRIKVTFLAFLAFVLGAVLAVAAFAIVSTSTIATHDSRLSSRKPISTSSPAPSFGEETPFVPTSLPTKGQASLLTLGRPIGGKSQDTSGDLAAHAAVEEANRARARALATVAESIYSSGTITYNPPREMAMFEEKTFSVRVSASPHNIRIEQVNSPDQPVMIDNIHYSNTMRATLTSKDFTIRGHQDDAAAEFIPGERDEYAEWTWDICPQREGKDLTLTLTLYPLVQVDGVIGSFQPKSYTRTIRVAANPPIEAANFAKEHIEFLWGLLVVPVLGWLKRRYVGRKNAVENA